MNFTDLQTKGYLVIPNFLNQDNIDRLLKEYSTVLPEFKANPENVNKNYNSVSSTYPHGLHDLIYPLLAEIRDKTDIHVDHASGIGDYLDTDLIHFDWHQDHETYYMWQNNYHTLNFWMPLIKENPMESGLDVIPFDRLGEYRKLLEGRGASRYQTSKDYTIMLDDEWGKTYVLNLRFSDVGETIPISAGDLLILRGDIVHRTQPKTTPRVAFSIRCTNTQGWLSYDRFLTRCRRKSITIDQHPGMYQLLIKKFESGNGQVQISEIISDQPNWG